MMDGNITDSAVVGITCIDQRICAIRSAHKAWKIRLEMGDSDEKELELMQQSIMQSRKRIKSTSKPKLIRDYGDKQDSSEDEMVIKRSAPKVVLKTNDADLPESEKILKKMDTDLEERDAFVARMQEKEDIKTKKLTEKGLSADQLKELAMRGSISSGTAQVRTDQ